MNEWDRIKQEVEASGDVKTFSMEDLRDAHQAGRLGKHVRRGIRDELVGLGLGHVPLDLPNDQKEIVRLYKRGTKVGNLIETVMRPGDLRDTQLREIVQDDASENAEIIAQIRELVAE